MRVKLLYCIVTPAVTVVRCQCWVTYTVCCWCGSHHNTNLTLTLLTLRLEGWLLCRWRCQCWVTCTVCCWCGSHHNTTDTEAGRLAVVQVKVSMLSYLHSLSLMLEPTDLVNSSDVRLAVSRIVTWTTEPKSVEVRKVFYHLIFSLYYFVNNTHTHTRLTALFPGLPGWAVTRKIKPIWILLKQEPVSASGISWAICKSASRSTQITMPAPHHSVFTGWMPFLPPIQQRQSAEGKQVDCFIVFARWRHCAAQSYTWFLWPTQPPHSKRFCRVHW